MRLVYYEEYAVLVPGVLFREEWTIGDRCVVLNVAFEARSQTPIVFVRETVNG